MNILERIKAFGEKMPILAITVSVSLKAFAIAAIAAVASFLLLWSVGIYDNLETALDLKYNSPLLLVPMWVLVAAFALCMVVGLLMYFHKYKRPKVKSAFGEALAPALRHGTRKEG